VTRLLSFLAATTVLVVVGLLVLGSLLFAPVPRPAGAPPDDLKVEPVEFPSESGSRVHGWFVNGAPGHGGVILMHGVRANRTSMINRTRFLHTAGYSVLLFDFQAHGESPGDRITFGYLEARDASAAARYLQLRLPDEPIAALGTSLGGAAAVLGTEPLPVRALVLEAVYPTLKEAVTDRLALRLGPIAPLLTPLLLAQVHLRLGFDPTETSPITAISRVRCPVLVIAGSADQRTTLSESRRLFEAAPEPKELWVVQGATHVDLYRFAGKEYENHVLPFFQRYLPVNGRADR